MINASSFGKWKQQITQLLDVLSSGKKLSKRYEWGIRIIESENLRMACEEQRNRIEKLQQEMAATTSEDSKSNLQQQILKETGILEEREFFVHFIFDSYLV